MSEILRGCHSVIPRSTRVLAIEDLKALRSNVDGKAKPYQVKQLLRIIEQYNLRLEEEK